MDRAPVIDSHIHFWELARFDYWTIRPDMTVLRRDHLPRDLYPQLQHAGVDGIVVVQAAHDVEETRFILDLAESHDFIAGIVGWVDARLPTAVDDVAAMAANSRLKGLRPVLDDNASIAWMIEDSVAPLFDAMADHGLSLDILIQDPDDLPVALALIERQRQLSIIIDHFAKPRVAAGEFKAWAGNMRRAAATPNVTCKFSGLLNQAGPQWTIDDLRPYAEHVLNVFGPDRLLWGSDWPPLRLAAEYDRWWDVSNELLRDLSAADRSRVFGGTAQRVYRLI